MFISNQGTLDRMTKLWKAIFVCGVHSHELDNLGRQSYNQCHTLVPSVHIDLGTLPELGFAPHHILASL